MRESRYDRIARPGAYYRSRFARAYRTLRASAGGRFQQPYPADLAAAALVAELPDVLVAACRACTPFVGARESGEILRLAAYRRSLSARTPEGV